MKNNSCDNGFVSLIKKFLQYINIFDIPRLTREIRCDVKHIREKYDETMHAIEKYKEDLRKEREIRENKNRSVCKLLFLQNLNKKIHLTTVRCIPQYICRQHPTSKIGYFLFYYMKFPSFTYILTKKLHFVKVC